MPSVKKIPLPVGTKLKRAWTGKDADTLEIIDDADAVEPIVYPISSLLPGEYVSLRYIDGYSKGTDIKTMASELREAIAAGELTIVKEV